MEYRYNWGGKFHPVPENFVFPTGMSCKLLWDAFFHGSNGNPPLSTLEGYDVSHKDTVNLSRARGVIRVIVNLAFKSNHFSIAATPNTTVLRMLAIKTHMHKLTIAESDDIFAVGFALLNGHLHGDSYDANAGNAYNAVYQDITVHDKKQSNEFKLLALNLK